MNVISPESPDGRPTGAASISFTENPLKLSPILQVVSMSGRLKKVAVPPALIRSKLGDIDILKVLATKSSWSLSIRRCLVSIA